MCVAGEYLPRHCHPLQFPLKCCAFPGAETARKQFLLRGASSPPKKLPRTRRTRRRVRLKRERACGPSRALSGEGTPRSRKADIHLAPAAQRPAPAASKATALIRRKAPIDPAPAAQRLAPAASQATAPIRQKAPNRPRACRAAASPRRLPNNGADTPQSTYQPRARRVAASPRRHRPIAERRRFKG